MTITKRLTLLLCFLSAVALVVAPARAEVIRITIRNLSPQEGVALSPFSIAAHDGTYDPFDAGNPASSAIENIAELGDGTQLLADIVADQPTAATGVVKATQGGLNNTIFTPGSSGSIELTVDPTLHRYLTFGAMVVPSNDAFVGNESPTKVALFDPMGNFIATDFTLVGSDIWDAGTEVNQLYGAAYVMGQDATQGDDERSVITSADLTKQFAPYLGSTTPLGNTFSAPPLFATPVASIHFDLVPEPSSLVLAALGMLSLAVLGYRRRRAMK